MTSDCYSPWGMLRALFDANAVPTACLASYRIPAALPPISIGQYLALFGLTCLIEFAWVRRPCTTFFLNLATHPLVTWIFPLWGFERFPTLAASELFALVTEALILQLVWRTSWSRAWGTSLLANLTSWGAGSALAAHFIL